MKPTTLRTDLLPTVPEHVEKLLTEENAANLRAAYLYEKTLPMKKFEDAVGKNLVSYVYDIVQLLGMTHELSPTIMQTILRNNPIVRKQFAKISMTIHAITSIGPEVMREVFTFILGMLYVADRPLLQDYVRQHSLTATTIMTCPGGMNSDRDAETISDAVLKELMTLYEAEQKAAQSDAEEKVQ